MKKYLIFITLFCLSFCSNHNNYNLSVKQEKELLKIVRYIRKNEFEGSIYIKKEIIRDSQGQIIDIVFPNYIYNLSTNNYISSIVVESEFIYFIMDGFKGRTFGLLFTKLKINNLHGFYNIEKIKECNLEVWYFVSSNFW